MFSREVKSQLESILFRKLKRKAEALRFSIKILNIIFCYYTRLTVIFFFFINIIIVCSVRISPLGAVSFCCGKPVSMRQTGGCLLAVALHNITT